jgi:hypothetical protein
MTFFNEVKDLGDCVNVLFIEILKIIKHLSLIVKVVSHINTCVYRMWEENWSSATSVRSPISCDGPRLIWDYSAIDVKHTLLI